MKAAYILILLSFCHVLCVSQANIQSDVKYFSSINAKAAARHSIIEQRKIIYSSSSKLHFPQDSLKGVIKNFIKRHNPANPSDFTSPYSRNLNSTCKDTSFVKLLGITSSLIYIEKITPLADDNILISGELYDTTRKPNFSWRSFPLLIKIDTAANIIWIKEFDNTDPNQFSTFYIYNEFELSNHDIICAASIDTTNGDEDDNTILYRLDKNGNIIWQTGLHTNITNAFPGLFDVTITGLAEGLNGDLILSALCNSTNSAGKYETIIRLNKTGNVIWDANYGNDGDYNFGAEAMNVYMDNGNITEVGVSHGSDYLFVPAAITVLKLDYNTGNTISKRFFKPNYVNDNDASLESFTYYYNQCTRLSNGHYIVSGKLFSDFENITPLIDHYGVVEFDADFNLLQAYTISSPVQTDYWDDDFFMNDDGKGSIKILDSKNYPSTSVYLGCFQNRQFLYQRQINFYNFVTTGNNGWVNTKDNGYIFVHNYVDSNSSFITFRKMHNSDTSSPCLGEGVNIFQSLPLNYIEDPLYNKLDTNKPNQVKNVHYNLSQNDTLKVESTNPCRQINYCDTVKVHGDSIVCVQSQGIIFTAYKNKACGGIVQWHIDSTAIDSMHVLNDTSVIIYFKNVSWKGYLAGSLPAGSCTIRATDSLLVTVSQVQSTIYLGADTTLCTGNKIELHAGSTFANYKWQDGSTDSLFTVTAAGIYYVSASNLCGSMVSDTIVIRPISFTFNIGNDTARCNNDSITLTAPPGFINYSWQPAYGTNTDTGHTINVSPAHDTSYIAVAEKVPGCFVSDTIHIAVYESPSIHLGNDTNLCSGQSLLLDAGNGFITYLWNTGSTSEKITVTQKGNYIIKATEGNGCISRDTLQVLNITPLPQFTLGNDTALCNGKVYTFHFALNDASYLWNDGSTAGDYTITLPGTYWLQVTQGGCAAGDTLTVYYKNSPSVNLGPDTTLCESSSYVLYAYNANASYMWQDGSSLPQLTVVTQGVYQVTVNLDGCTAADTVNINYLPKPFFTLGNDTVLCQGTTIALQPHINVASQYFWQDGTTQSYYVIKETGVYTLTATNICGSATDNIIVKPGLCNIILPNTFTPNNDGLNDVFRIKYPFSVKSFALSVFNRFGQQIFGTTDINKGWDGSYKGIPQPVGTYVWLIQLTDTKGITQNYKGLITLLR